MTTTKIEWTEKTWNPVTGCTKISHGCKNCYAERMARRLKAMGNRNYINEFKVTTHDHSLGIPLRWKKPQMIFVNSMSDLFHEEIPETFIHDVFSVMDQAHWHTFQVLTKRAERLAELSPRISWPKNVWMGVSVESEKYLNRIDYLRQSDATIKFISLEPLLGPVGKFDTSGIDWVIVGGESGPKARPMLEQWVVQIRDHCMAHRLPFFFKQWGGTNKKKTGRILQGEIWEEMPNSADGVCDPG